MTILRIESNFEQNLNYIYILYIIILYPLKYATFIQYSRNIKHMFIFTQVCKNMITESTYYNMSSYFLILIVSP